MVRITAAGSRQPVNSRRARQAYGSAPTGRQHAIDRVAKLGAVTVVRGAAPSEAEFAARRACSLIAQFGLGDHGCSPAKIAFRPSPPLAKPDAVTSPSSVLAAASAYRRTTFDRRSTSALRFVETA
jgi:hypothetical protein